MGMVFSSNELKQCSPFCAILNDILHRVRPDMGSSMTSGHLMHLRVANVWERMWMTLYKEHSIFKKLRI